jgi:hypothetical protein
VVEHDRHKDSPQLANGLFLEGNSQFGVDYTKRLSWWAVVRLSSALPWGHYNPEQILIAEGVMHIVA